MVGIAAIAPKIAAEIFDLEVLEDEIQTMKAGLMEIADLFVVNKGDRPDADLFIKNLKMKQLKQELQLFKIITTLDVLRRPLRTSLLLEICPFGRYSLDYIPDPLHT